VRKLFILFILFPAWVLAAPISFNFNEVSLLAFSQTTFKNLLHVDYVISPDVLAMDRKITLSIAEVEPAKVFEFVEGVLRQQGISVEKRGGVYYLLPSVRGDSASVPAASLLAPLASIPLPAMDHVSVVRADVALDAARKDDDESEIYVPVNRPSDFLVSVLASTFGDKSVSTAGSGVMITGSESRLKKMRQLLVGGGNK
jgi:general secretion pathway protein D